MKPFPYFGLEIEAGGVYTFSTKPRVKAGKFNVLHAAHYDLCFIFLCFSSLCYDLPPWFWLRLTVCPEGA